MRYTSEEIYKKYKILDNFILTMSPVITLRYIYKDSCSY